MTDIRPTARSARRSRFARRALIALVAPLAFVGAGASASSAGDLPRAHAEASADSSTTVPVPTNADAGASTEAPPASSEPETTTSAPATTLPETSTSLANTTTTLGPETTTSLAPETTTANPSSTSSSSTTLWIILGAAVLLGLVVALVLLLLARSRRQARTVWIDLARPALQQTVVVRSLLAERGGRDDRERRESIDAQVERAGEALSHLVEAAPDEPPRLAAAATASALRNLLFADEAERLLRAGGAPTGDQLFEADAARRSAALQLDAALAELNTLVNPEGRPPGSAANTVSPG